MFFHITNRSSERDDLILLSKEFQDILSNSYKDSQELFYIEGECWVGNDIGNISIIHLYNNTFVVAIFKNS